MLNFVKRCRLSRPINPVASMVECIFVTCSKQNLAECAGTASPNILPSMHFSAVTGHSCCLAESSCIFLVLRYAHTQPMMDLLLAPESFLLSERYASAVKTLGLAIFFMPVLPLSCVIALAGLHPLHSNLLPYLAKNSLCIDHFLPPDQRTPISIVLPSSSLQTCILISCD